MWTPASVRIHNPSHPSSWLQEVTSFVSRVISLGVQQCVRELQKQAPQGGFSGPAQPFHCQAAVSAVLLGPILLSLALLVPCPAATVVVFGLLPIQPMMLHAPQRVFDELVGATNAALQQYVQVSASPKLRYKGEGRDCAGASKAAAHKARP